jgi:hypothetical protein
MQKIFFSRHIILSMICLIFLIQSSCLKEDTFENPVVFTGDIMHVTSTGAVFHGKIVGQGSGIIDHGFVWDQHDQPLIGKAYQRSLGVFTTEDFSSSIEGAFKEGELYYVRSYVRDSKTTVYGRTAVFKSLGGAAPEVLDFYPKQGTWNDTLTIRGKNFSRLTDQNLVKIGIASAFCLYASDTLLKVIVPVFLEEINSNVSVTIFGNTSTFTDEFVLLPPEVLEITPDEGPFLATVTITGKHFHPLAKVFFDNKQAGVISSSGKHIQVKVPSFDKERDVKIKVNILGQTSKENLVFKYHHPVITGFSSLTGTWDDRLVIYGRNLLVHNWIYVKFEDVFTLPMHKSKDSITVKVPRSLSNYSNFISIIDDYHQLNTTSEMKFELIKPTITASGPMQGDFNDLVEIEGSFFHPEKYENHVSFGGVLAEIVSYSSSLLKVKVPVELQGLSNTISLQIHDFTISTEESFQLNPPHIDKAEALWFARSFPLKLHGSGLNPEPSHNKVFWGGERLWVNASSPDFIQAGKGFDYTNNNPPNEFRNIQVEVAGQLMMLNDPVRFYEPWSYHHVNGHWLRSVNEVGFSIGERHFVAEHRWLLEYLPGTNTVVRRADMPVTTSGLYDYSNASTFTAESKAYFLHSTGFYSYDPATDSWSVMNNFPSVANKGTHAFKAGDTGYMIGAPITFADNGITREGREVWRYNEADDSWTQVAGFPAQNILRGISFTLNGKGYVGLGMGPDVNKIWEYDPADDSWQEKIDLTDILGLGMYYSSSVFVLNNLVYIAGGHGSHSAYSSVYRYDPQNNVFTPMIGLPSGNNGAFGFTHQGKGFVIGGYGGGSYTPVQIFDPAKLPPSMMQDY